MANTDWQNSLNWYMGHFPESQFLVPKDHKEEYNKRVILGHSIASKSNVLICGIVRNAASVLPYTLARIEALGKLFGNYHVFLYENDSKDETKKILSAAQSDRLTVQMEDLNPPTFHDLKGLDRRIWMAKARNQYLAFARKYAQQQRINYLIIVDTDLQGGWSYHGVLNSLGQIDWDIIGSNSLYYFEKDDRLIRLFYDSWAFRSDGIEEEVEDNIVNLFKFNRGEPLIKVNSCFGGLGIYKPHFLYEGIDYDETDCDHPTLHNRLCKKDYNIFLNPSQITLYNKTEYVI